MNNANYPILALRSLSMLAEATHNGSSEGISPRTTFTLPGETRLERQAEAERRIMTSCLSLGFPFSPSLEQYREDLETWNQPDQG